MGQPNISDKGRNWAVLVVEDDPLVRATGVDLFAELGLRAYGAYNGAEALRLLRDKPQIRLVLADVRMPGMDGPQLAQEIARLHPDVRVVLTSGYVREEQVGDYAFVPKPWRTDLIAAVLDAQ